MSFEGELKRKGRGRNDSMDPTGQSYLPGYFCPAALIHSSNHTRHEEGRYRDRNNTKIIVPQINRSE